MIFNPSWIKPDPAISEHGKSRFSVSFKIIHELLSELLHSYGSIQEIERSLPIMTSSDLTAPGSIFTIQVLASGTYTQGAGRYIADMLSTYIVPGKYTTIPANRSSRLLVCGKPAFYTEYLIELPSSDDLPILQANIRSVLRMLKATLHGGVYVRKLLEKKPLSDLEERMIIQQNVADLSDESFGPFHNKFTSELAKSVSNTTYEPILGTLKKSRSTMFRRDLFHTMQRYYFSLPTEIGKTLTPKNHGKVLGLLFYFKKMLLVQKGGVYGRVIPYEKQGGKYQSLLVLFCSTEPMHDLPRVISTCQKVVPHSTRVSEFSIDDVKEGMFIGTYGVVIKRSDDRPFSSEEYHTLKEQFVATMHSNIPARPLSSFDTLVSLSKRVRLATSEKHATIIEKLTSSILSSGKENKSLLRSYVSSFSLLPERSDEAMRALLTGYYMLHSLLERGETSELLSTSAQRVDGYFLLAIESENSFLHSATSHFMQKYKKTLYPSSFRVAGSQYVLLVFPYNSPEDLGETRDAITQFIQRIEVDFESGIEYTKGV